MSRLDELIQELCPDGVEYRLFYDVCSYTRGITYSKTDEDNTGSSTGIPVLRANNITLESNTINLDDIKFVSSDVKVLQKQWLKQSDILICAGSGSKEHIGKVAYIFDNMDYTFGGFMGVIRPTDDALLPRYLFHVLTSTFFKRHIEKASGGSSSTINNINNDTWNKWKFPVPPIEVQREIVRILDNFTELTAELTAELTTELTARKKQYDYYRNKLLSFGKEIPTKTIGEISSYRRGSFPQPYGNKEWYDGEGAMPFVQVADIGDDMRLVDDTKRKISKLAQKKSVFAPTGSIVISLQGSIGRIAVTQYDAYIDRTVAIFHNISSIVLEKYFVYQLQRIFSIKEKTARGSTIKTITKEEFTDFSIAIPPIEEQRRIVAILDRLEALCNDISSGIPAEIEARQKQYEYYRDKLLTFMEKK